MIPARKTSSVSLHLHRNRNVEKALVNAPTILTSRMEGVTSPSVWESVADRIAIATSGIPFASTVSVLAVCVITRILTTPAVYRALNWTNTATTTTSASSKIRSASTIDATAKWITYWPRVVDDV